MNNKLLRTLLWQIHSELAPNEGAVITLPKTYRNHLWTMPYEFFPSGPHNKQYGYFGNKQKRMVIYLDDIETMRVEKFSLGIEEDNNVHE